MRANRRKGFWGLFIVVTVGVGVGVSHRFDFAQRLEWLTHDARAAALRARHEPSPDIAVVLVDEASLRALNRIAGRWPWPRSLFADVLEFMTLAAARAVVFDILFTENERSPGASTATMSPNDRALAAATAASGVTYHAAQILRDTPDEFNESALNRALPADFVSRFALHAGVAIGAETIVPSTEPGNARPNNNYYLPFPELYRVARGIGVVDLSPDLDGVFRRVMPITTYGDARLPTLGLAPLVARAATPAAHHTQGPPAPPQTALPLGSDGKYLVNVYGEFSPYSIGGVLASIQMLRDGELTGLPIDPREFRDKIVFIGTSAVGLADLKPTPASTKTPGVFLHASVASNVLLQDYLQVIAPTTTTVLALLLAAAVVAGILAAPNIWVHFAVPVCTTTGYVGWTVWRFTDNAVWPLFAPVTAIALAWLLASAYLAFTEGKDRRKVRRMFSQYVSAAVLSEVVDRYEDHLRAEVGRKERLTILFSDIRGFTGLSERLTAARIVELLNIYFSSMSDAVFQHRGTIDKYIGDAIMCFWGAPVRLEDHADRALHTALTMIGRLGPVNRDLAAKGYPVIEIGIGINTGDVVLGNIGSEHKLDYTVIGDDVNLASRLEGLTKVYETPILLSQQTQASLRDQTPCAVVDLVRVKGKQVPIRIFRPLCVPDAARNEVEHARRLVRDTAAAFEAYLQRDWSRAMDLYARLPRDRVAELFLARCREYSESEPTSWDGAFTLDTK
jgi:adenylate cyclase